MMPFVFVVDDGATVRGGLKVLLDAAGYEAAVFADWPSFLAALEERGGAHAVLLLDIKLGRDNGLELYRTLRNAGKQIPVIFMTAYADLPMAVEALRLEAVDFLEKPLRRADLFNALERAARHGAAAPADAASYSEAARCFAELSPREEEVFRGMVSGESSKAIARRLGISPRTVEVHRARVLQKMQADNLADLVRKAVALGNTK